MWSWWRCSWLSLHIFC